jgi:acetoin utilization deacetylase AcuC-like enzyme
MIAANIAVSAVINGIENIHQNKWKNGFAIVRPPGHHAHGVSEKFNVNGFCLLNNIAIGANYLLRKYKF